MGLFDPMQLGFCGAPTSRGELRSEQAEELRTGSVRGFPYQQIAGLRFYRLHWVTAGRPGCSQWKMFRGVKSLGLMRVLR